VSLLEYRSGKPAHSKPVLTHVFNKRTANVNKLVMVNRNSSKH